MTAEANASEDVPHYLVVLCHLPEFTPAVLEYSRRVAELVPRFGGEYVMRGGPAAVLEGEWSARVRLVVSRWPNRRSLEAFWNSDEYQREVKPLRAGTGLYDVVIYPDVTQALSPLRSQR